MLPILNCLKEPGEFNKEQKERLDLYAEIVGKTRQQLLEAIIESSLIDLDIMDKIDFLVRSVKISDHLEMFKKSLANQKD